MADITVRMRGAGPGSSRRCGCGFVGIERGDVLHIDHAPGAGDAPEASRSWRSLRWKSMGLRMEAVGWHGIVDW